MKTSTLVRKTYAILIALSCCLSVLPLNVLAEEESDIQEVTEQTEEITTEASEDTSEEANPEVIEIPEEVTEESTEETVLEITEIQESATEQEEEPKSFETLAEEKYYETEEETLHGATTKKNASLSATATVTEVNASSLVDNAQWVVPEGDVVLHMDVDKTIKSIYKNNTGSLTIDGYKKLTINNTVNIQSETSNGIYLQSGSLTIDGPEAVNITTAYVQNTTYSRYANGIYAGNITFSDTEGVNIVSYNPCIRGSKVTVEYDANVTVETKGTFNYNYMAGLYCSQLIVDGNLSVTHTTASKGYAIYCPTFTFNKGHLYAKADSAGYAIAGPSSNFNLSNLARVTKPESYRLSTATPNEMWDESNNKAATEVEIYGYYPTSLQITNENGNTSIPVLLTGQEIQLKVKSTPEYANNNVIWTVSDDTIANITQDGVFTALSRGVVEVTATSAVKETVVAKKTVKVRGENDPTSLTIANPNGSTYSYDFHRLLVGTTYPFSVVASPEGKSNDVIWSVSSTSDEPAFTVDENGNVTALKAGGAILVATSAYDNTVIARQYMTVANQITKLDFSQSEYAYDGNNRVIFGYLDYDGIEYNNLGYLHLKDYFYESDDRYAINMPAPRYMDSVGLHLYGDNVITSNFNDASSGAIIKMGGRYSTIYLEDGASLKLEDNGNNEGIHCSSLNVRSEGEGTRGKLEINSNSTGWSLSTSGSDPSYVDQTGSGDGVDIIINAPTGIECGRLEMKLNDSLIVNANDYGFKGSLLAGKYGNANITATARTSQDHGIGMLGVPRADGSDLSGSPRINIKGSAQAVQWEGINYDGTLDRITSQYVAITKPVNHDFSTSSVIDKSTGSPAKEVTVEAVTVSVKDGIGSGNYSSGANVSISANEINGYQFLSWEAFNTNGLTDNIFNAGSDQNAATTIIVPEGRTILQPKYTMKEYTITYDLDGGSVTGTNPEVYTIGTNEFTLINPRKSGYAFKGWIDMDNPSDPVKTITIPKGSTGNRSFKAEYEPFTMSISCSGSPMYVGEQYQLSVEYSNDEYIDDPSVTWTCSDTSVATIDANGVITIKDTAYYYSNVSAYNAETDTTAYFNLSPKYRFNFYNDTTVRGNLETDGYRWVGNASTPYLELKNFNYETDYDSAIILPAKAEIHYWGSNSVTTSNINPSTYIVKRAVIASSSGGYPANTEDAQTSLTFISMENGAELSINATGDDNGIECDTIFFGDTIPNSNQYCTGTITINTPQSAVTQYVVASSYSVKYKTKLNINADIGFDFRTTRTIKHKAASVVVGTDGELNIQADNYGILGASSFNGNSYSAKSNIEAIAKNADDAGVAINTYTVSGTIGNHRFYGSNHAIEFAAEYSTYSGFAYIGNDCIVKPADHYVPRYVPVEIITLVDAIADEPAKEVISVYPYSNYTITYELNGGTVDGYNPKAYSRYSDDFTLINPTKTGFNFTGWMLNDSEEKQMEVTVLHTETERKTFTATWEPIQYAITYDLNGGAAESNPDTYTIESESIILNNPERDYYTFDGWSEGNNGEITQAAVIQNGSTGDKTFTAHWTPVEYTLAYDYQGGIAENPGSYNVETETFTLNVPEKEGYEFETWHDEDGTPLSDVTIEKGSHGDRSYTAIWHPATYTIEYNLDGGSFTKENATSYTIESDDIVVSEPQRDGYEFAGWLDKDGNNAGKMLIIPQGTFGNLEYTAQWTLIIVNPEVVYMEEDEISLIAGQAYTLSAFFYPENTTDQSITWSSSDENVASVNEAGTVTANSRGTATITVTSVADESLTYDCVVNVSELTVTFEFTGENTIPDQHPLYGQKAERPEDPVWEGYAFIGWAASEETYDFNLPVTEDITLNGVWGPVDYAISYELDGGAAENPSNYTIETETFTLNNPVKEGYRFLGWTGSNGEEPQTEVTVAKGSTGNLNYTAHWEREADYVTLNKASLSLEEGRNEILVAVVMPQDTVDKEITWSSSDESVATVGSDGLVIAVAEGEAVITAATSNGKTDTCVVTVTKKVVPVVKVSVKPTSAEVMEAETVQLSATILPATATDPSIIWFSSDETVAAVDQNGVVTGVSAGTATITAASNSNPDRKGTCTVTVTENPALADGMITMKGSTLVLDGTISVSFYVQVSDEKLHDIHAEATLNGRTITIPGDNASYKGVHLYAFKVPVAAKECRDTIKIKFVDSDGNAAPMSTPDGRDITEGYEYSVYAYTSNVAQTDSIKTLCDALGNYGSYAQVYFNHNTQDISLTDVSGVTLSMVEDYKAGKTGEMPEGLVYKGASLILESETTVRQYFQPEEGHEIGEYLFLKGEEAVIAQYNHVNGLYYVDVENVPSGRLSYNTSLTVRKDDAECTITYSPYSYVRGKLKNSTDENLQNLCRALYLYGEAAKEYFEQ